MIRGILFDLDGTLLDTSEGILESVEYTIRTLKLPMLSRRELLQFVGPPIQNSLSAFLGLNAEESQRGATVFRNYYKEKALCKAVVYDGIFDVLDYLKQKDIKIGVATYKREDYAKTLLEHFGIASYCDVIHGADNENRLRKSDIVSLCCGELGCGLPQIALVGDTVHDAEGACKAGVKFIAVTWGFGYKEENVATLSFPYIGIAYSPKDLPMIIGES